MELEQQFLRLLDIVERIQNKVCQLEEENKRLIRGQKQMLEWVEMNQQDNVHFQENISYELRALLQQPQEGTYFPRILPGEAAIEEIVGHGKTGSLRQLQDACATGSNPSGMPPCRNA